MSTYHRGEYTFYGGPIHGQSCVVASRPGTRLPPHVYSVRVAQPLTLAADWETYKNANPTPQPSAPIHDYRYHIEYDHYKYLGVR